MCGVGRRHSGDGDQTAPHQRFEGARLRLRLEKAVERGRTGRETIEEYRFAPARIADDPIGGIDAKREPADIAAAPRGGPLPFQGVRHQLRMPRR